MSVTNYIKYNWRLFLKNYLFLLPFLCLVGCKNEDEVSLEKRFITITSDVSGIDFINQLTPTPELNILNYIYYYNGGGVAAADFNGDGLTDLYFTANQDEDKLYLNNGNLKFSDITTQAAIDNASGWTTGVTTVDINSDGLMDIYVCKLNGYGNIQGHNLLYVNQGNNSNGIPQFKEQSADYKLDFRGFSTQAAFFDYDTDGDLDVFLLNHSVNPNQNYGKGSRRSIPNEESGDKLLENQDGIFVNVSETAGILQSKIGYGLGVAVSDLNNDGYPDIYISNDFFENDYLYINNGDKTFSEKIQQGKSTIGHTTHFSMGNDIGDINNDGYNDIISTDMLPEDLNTYKTSGTEFNYQIYQNYIRNGYAHQYMQNTLQLNNGNNTFSEIAYLSGIAASEWSWAPLFADYDNNGTVDLFISNGIPGATNDMDFINFIANDEIQRSLGSGMTETEMAFIDKIPEKKTVNYFFSNEENGFNDATETWASLNPSFSNGSVYTDLDNDGDLDLVVNNINETATILENKTTEIDPTSNYLSIHFNGSSKNTHGIGATVCIYQDDMTARRDNFTTRGYLSAVPSTLHFGIPGNAKLDSLLVVWPDKKYELLYDVNTNTSLTLDYQNATGEFNYDMNGRDTAILMNSEALFDFKHSDNTSIAFNRDPLIPFAMTNEGPGISVGDINNDGLDDVFISGGKFQSSVLLEQQPDGSFGNNQTELFEEDAKNEDIAQQFFDANGDGWLDLVVVSGGDEFKDGDPIRPRLYVNDNGTFTKADTFDDITVNASAVQAVDYDHDGDQDLCILSSSIPGKFGITPRHYVLENDGSGNFSDVTQRVAPVLMSIGNCTAMDWVDVDSNGYPDLIVAGDWMPIRVLLNDGKSLEPINADGLQDTAGFWNTVKAVDIDMDGDLDIIAGNWGENSRLQAAVDQPISLYKVDVDDNGSEETLITYYYDGTETPLASKDELTKQIPGINKKFLSYADFAQAQISDLFGSEKLEKAMKKEVVTTSSAVYINDGNLNFSQRKLPPLAQFSSVNDISIEDFNNDGFPDLFLAGNNFEISTQLSSLDALHGGLFLNDGKGSFAANNNQYFDVSGACRKIEKLRVSGKDYLIVARNNNQPVFLRINKSIAE